MEKNKDYQIEFMREAGTLEKFSSSFKEVIRTSEGLFPFEQNRGWDNILFGQEITSLRARVSNLEELEERKRDSLKITRPHVETDANEKGVLFEQLQESIKNLLSNFKDLGLRLSSFMELKNALANLNKEARKWGDVYLLRSIVVFYASIRHAYAEEIDKKQCDIIEEVGNTMTRETIDRNKYREIYKRLRSVGFRIIPEPSPVQK